MMHPVWSSSGWGLPSRPGHPDRWCALTAPFHPYHAFGMVVPWGDPHEPFGGLFSAALSLTSRPVDVIDHPALRSPDFPPVVNESKPPAITPPTDSVGFNITVRQRIHKRTLKISSRLGRIPHRPNRFRYLELHTRCCD